MPHIMINCPSTNKPLPTGISVGDQAAFDNNSFTNNSVQCPHCQQMHTWSKKDAWVEEVC